MTSITIPIVLGSFFLPITYNTSQSLRLCISQHINKLRFFRVSQDHFNFQKLDDFEGDLVCGGSPILLCSFPKYQFPTGPKSLRSYYDLQLQAQKSGCMFKWNLKPKTDCRDLLSLAKLYKNRRLSFVSKWRSIVFPSTLPFPNQKRHLSFTKKAFSRSYSKHPPLFSFLPKIDGMHLLQSMDRPLRM